MAAEEQSSNATKLPKHRKLREAFCQQQTKAVGQSFTVYGLVLPDTSTFPDKDWCTKGPETQHRGQSKKHKQGGKECDVPESKRVSVWPKSQKSGLIALLGRQKCASKAPEKRLFQWEQAVDCWKGVLGWGGDVWGNTVLQQFLVFWGWLGWCGWVLCGPWGPEEMQGWPGMTKKQQKSGPEGSFSQFSTLE